MKTIALEFDGVWLDAGRMNVPSQSGIYCVYTCTYDKKGSANLHDLLYIGESSDVSRRLQYHDRYADWVACLKNDEVLCYSFAPVSSEERERAEAALILKCQPPLNEEHMKQFIYPDTEIITSGCNHELPSSFRISKGATR